MLSKIKDNINDGIPSSAFNSANNEDNEIIKKQSEEEHRSVQNLEMLAHYNLAI